MYRSFNKLGSIEVNGNELKYRISTQELNVDDSLEIERDIKRVLQVIENQDLIVLPYDIQTVNRYMVLFYNLSHYHGLDSLRELSLEEQLPYFLSLVEMAKAERKGIKVLWDKMNLVVDKHEKSIKALLFETQHLKLYEVEDPFKSVVDIMICSMTTLSKVIGVPKKNDFIDMSEDNINFAQTILDINNLDDLSMYIETKMIDFEYQEEETIDLTKNKKLFKTPKVKKPKTEKKKPTQKRRNVQTNTKKGKGKSKEDKMMKLGIIGFIGAMLVYFLLPYILPTNGSDKNNQENVVAMNNLEADSKSFTGSKKYNNDLVTVYRKAYNSEYKDAYNILVNIPKKELSSSDVPLIIKVYNENNHLGLLVDEMPVLASDVITFLITTDKMDQLPDIAASMQTKNADIEFEVAYMTSNYNQVLSYINKIKINGRREQQILTAYLGLNKVDQARDFANKVGNPDLIKQVDTFKN